MDAGVGFGFGIGSGEPIFWVVLSRDLLSGAVDAVAGFGFRGFGLGFFASDLIVSVKLASVLAVFVETFPCAKSCGVVAPQLAKKPAKTRSRKIRKIAILVPPSVAGRIVLILQLGALPHIVS